MKARLKIPTASTVSDTTLQALLDSAASTIDRVGRKYILGKEAFSATTSETRYFDDVIDEMGLVRIDDLLTVTEVIRGGVTISASYYDLYPYNIGNGCYTYIRFTQDNTSLAWPGLNTRYNYPFAGVGTKQLQITGTWGFCTSGNRPAEVKEATIIQAGYLYQLMNLAKEDVVLVSQSNRREPIHDIHPSVKSLLWAIREWGTGL